MNFQTKGRGALPDASEAIRRQLAAEINAAPASREALEAEHGQVWDTDQLRQDFEVLRFLAPFVVVRRRADGIRGSLLFQHHPRFYFSFLPETLSASEIGQPQRMNSS